MLSHQRQRELLRQIRSRGTANVSDLAASVGVSLSTIRRDLNEMDGQGLLTRVHGGASVAEDDVESARMAREYSRIDEKWRIGAAAAELVHDNMTVLITGGTTTEAMLTHLANRVGLTVITNGLNVALRLQRFPAVTVVVLGGVLRHEEMSLLGALAEQAVDEFQIDRAFLGAYGIDATVGLSAASVHEARTDQRLIDAVPSLVVLADSSKFGQRGPVRLVPVERIGALISDTGAPSDCVEQLRVQGVDVHLV